MTDFDNHDSIEDRYVEHIIADYLRRLDRGEQVDREQLLKEQPSCEAGLKEYFDLMDRVENMAGPHLCGNAKDSELGNASLSLSKPKARDGWVHKDLPFSFGRYRVLRRLGEGGMGTVYLADDTNLDRQVALKIPRLLADSNEENRKWLARFVGEAKINVQHPNICTIYDTGICDNRPYISMAYIDGQPLAALVAVESPLPEEEIATLVRIIALAVDAAHQAGIVHRDLKPSNIMIDVRGQPIVMDFGLALRIFGGCVRLTSCGIVGTPAYLSPEQLECNPDCITPSTDIYSLGVTFYELLTGRRPFKGTLPQMLRQIQEQPPDPPSRLRPGLNRTLEAICLRMMAKRPVDRFGSMKAVADELDCWLKMKTAGSESASELQLVCKQMKKLYLLGATATSGLAILEITELLAPHVIGGHEPPSEDNHTSELLPHSSTHDGNWHSPFEDLLPEHAPIDKADPHFGTPDHDRTFWEGQQSYSDTCAIRCQEFILQQFTGVDFPEKLLVDEAKEHGWYSPGHGTSMENVGNLLELHGVTVNRYMEANVFHLANELAQGHKVIIGVESSKLWGNNSMMDSMLETIRDHFGLGGGADHAVVVSGIDTTDPHHVKVIISDPGDGRAVAAYPMEQFLHAWEGSHFYMVTTQQSAPAHLPEMVHFDYTIGHVDSIADVPFEKFVEQFAHHHDSWEHVLDHYMHEHSAESSVVDDHGSHLHGHPDQADHDHPDSSYHDDHHGALDFANHHLHEHDGIGEHHEDSAYDDHHTDGDYTDLT